jgi:hypothetical protein
VALVALVLAGALLAWRDGAPAAAYALPAVALVVYADALAAAALLRRLAPGASASHRGGSRTAGDADERGAR